MTIQNLQKETYNQLFKESEDFDVSNLYFLIDEIINRCSIIEGSGAPTFVAIKHAQYFDTAANRYYRNVDGSTTWVALN